MKKNNFILHILMFLMFSITICNLENLEARTYNVTKSRKNLILTRSKLAKSVIRQLRSLPESNNIIERALRDGSITLLLVNNSNMLFEAMWECSERKIVVDMSIVRDRGKLLNCILFELHNAASTQYYNDLWNQAHYGEISGNAYVEKIEKREHENAISTANILNKGIAYGLFPMNACWNIITDFDTHYKIQQLTGHSDQIAREYDHIKPNHMPRFVFTGTIPGIKKMSPRQKESMAGHLYTRYMNSKYQS